MKEAGDIALKKLADLVSESQHANITMIHKRSQKFASNVFILVKCSVLKVFVGKIWVMYL